jgi:histidinol-phosphate/aromatic aminotransferase/cobyric acid decarboxylase-like protein
MDNASGSPGCAAHERASGAAARAHGGLDDAELAGLGLAPDELLDFSSSTNPYGPSPGMLRALSEAAVGRYPDITGRHARQALSASIGFGPDELVLGNGAADLLWSIARCLLGPGGRACIVEPTFCEFRAAAHAVGAELVEWRSQVEDAFEVDLTAVGKHARATAASVVYVCSPNTPTGHASSALELRRFAESYPELTLVLDQSFLSLSELHADAAERFPSNVVLVRSLTKDHGIPGVRVGYVVAAPALCRALEAGRPAWTTSAFAQAAVLESCRSASFVAESRERLLADRRELAKNLSALGIETFPSRATFLLARVPNLAALRPRLMSRHHVVVRDCTSFGLPGFMRLGAKPPAARARLCEALRAELGA